MKAHDTFCVVVTTGKRPYTLPSHLRIVRVTATWEVKP